MNDIVDTSAPLQESLQAAFTQSIEYLPSLFAAISVLVVGWIIARLARGGSKRFANSMNRILDRVLKSGSLARARVSSGAAALFGECAYWLIIFVAVTIAARLAGLTGLHSWLGQIVTHLPNLLIGGAIIIVGYVVSSIVEEQITTTARAAKTSQGALMGRFAQLGIFVTALIIGLDQIGVNVTFLIALFVVSIGSIFVGFSIAFGLGAKDHVRNLIGARAAQSALQSGLHVRIGETEGDVLEITPSHVALDTAQGRTLIPARIIGDQAIEILTSAGERDNG